MHESCDQNNIQLNLLTHNCVIVTILSTETMINSVYYVTQTGRKKFGWWIIAFPVASRLYCFNFLWHNTAHTQSHNLYDILSAIN